MTVNELIRKLESVENKDRIVVLARDEEGNGFQELRDINLDNSSFKDAEMGLEHLTPELKKEGYSEEDIINGQSCIVLWP